jgi:hypothetical protein
VSVGVNFTFQDINICTAPYFNYYFIGTSSSDDSSCKNCPIYIIAGSIVGIITLFVVCALLLAVMIYIIIHSNKSDTSNQDHHSRIDPSGPVYEDITSPVAVYECLNPMATSVMIENEAYNTCCDKIGAYDII